MSLLNDASLVFIPSGYKEDKVYSIIPSNGAGDLDFVRGCDATRINPQSLVEGVSWNLVQQSEAFDNAYWNKSNTSIVANQITAPNGTLTADKSVIAANNSYHDSCIGSYSIIAGNTYTVSIYAKKGVGIESVYFYEANTNSIAKFNLNDGTYIGYAPTNGYNQFQSYGSENAGNGWYRFYGTFTAVSTTSNTLTLGISTNITNTVVPITGNGSDYLYIWGAQSNIGSLKPYFPTTDRLNVPRLDYTNSTCPSLLLEKQSTNLALYSEQFDNGAWVKVNGGGTASVSVTANYGISPDGTQNADRIQLNKGNTGYAEIYQPLSVANGTTYTQTMWLKSLSGTPKINFGYTGTTRGTITLTTEWQRYTFTYVSSGVSNAVALTLFDGFDSSTAQSIDVLAWGAQIEASSYPTSYIPTTSATATRLADSCYKTGISSLIGQTEGTMFIEVTDIAKREQGRYLFLSDATFTNRIVIYQGSGNLNVYCSAGSTFNLTYSLPSGRSKIAFGYKSGLYSLFVNGVERATNTLSAVPSNLSAFGIGSSEGSIGTPEPLDSSVSQALLFKRRLTNTELENLTTL